MPHLLFRMSELLPTIAVQPDLLGNALGVAVSIVVSFVVITLVASYYRFQNIVKLADEKQPEEIGATAGDVLRVQLARYLAGCARRNTGFSMALIRVEVPGVVIQMDSPVVHAVRHAARNDDITCIYDDSTAVFFAESEPEDSGAILERIAAAVATDCPEVPFERLRIGIASYPGHGLSGRELIQVALDGLGQATAEQPVVIPEIVDTDAEDEEDSLDPIEGEDAGAVSEETVKRKKGNRKDSMLDPVTGVLKPSVVSTYMQRMMSDLRYKKKPVSLFCIGVNNMEHIARFHGDDAADDVLAGVSRILQEHLRADDLIGRHEKYAFLVLAQCSLEKAGQIGKRIGTLVQQSGFASGNKMLKTTITLGLAAYPEHGRNLHHLYSAGQKVLDYSRSNDIRAYAVYDPEIHDRVSVKPMRSIKSVQA